LHTEAICFSNVRQIRLGFAVVLTEKDKIGITNWL
jgi:hypothetical protein